MRLLSTHIQYILLISINQFIFQGLPAHDISSNTSTPSQYY